MSICPICQKDFKKSHHNQQYCSKECSGIAIKHNHKRYCDKVFKSKNEQKQPSKKSQHLDAMVRDCEVYNKIHGTRLSYGQYIAMKRLRGE